MGRKGWPIEVNHTCKICGEKFRSKAGAIKHFEEAQNIEEPLMKVCGIYGVLIKCIWGEIGFEIIVNDITYSGPHKNILEYGVNIVDIYRLNIYDDYRLSDPFKSTEIVVNEGSAINVFNYLKSRSQFSANGKWLENVIKQA
ncbi:MAG: hypothetical protein UT66_C0025G0011 [candidate division CPR2 bacterium GW2011_GWC1_39_9]|uniref:C2H2-type domain-containing protein n=1 Tax=candidate division CPR2 bacterium GW2011_GWC2_39_10 TaxID=1618345 RepID=A0A0G0LTL4_UNCC2|nr:MAG: hypothetical protein UT18_C0002G0055 [candidate division CPR2 bacterium GW2011_GWC2_39_10]KKR34354.1 MAG: hypothetical protein UT66_C0025G0011 [candidate division CPR2 bacterium GW2011_GWC1_39_9]